MDCEAPHQDYELLLSQYKTLRAKRRGAEDALRLSFKELSKRLTLIANILVDGGLLRSEMDLATPGHEEVLEIKAAVGVPSGEARHFFAPKPMAAMQEYVA